MRKLTDALLLRHLTEPDIPGRILVLNDLQVRRNISSLPVLYDQDALAGYFLDIVRGHNPSRIEFVLTKKDGTVTGYTYLLDVDHRGRICEIGLITVPRYRFGYGLVALLKTYEYAFGVLNMRSVLNEVYAGNGMMSNERTVIRRAQATAVAGQFTEGEIRDSHFWTETRHEFPRRFGDYLQAKPEKGGAS